MMKRRRLRAQKEADLDITSFMNLMIILVPVLLMSMVFSHITVLDLKLPDLASDADQAQEDKKKQLEVVIHEDYIDVNYPAGLRLKRIVKVLPEADPSLSGETNLVNSPDTENVSIEPQELLPDYDFKLLSVVLQEVKRQLKEKDIDKRDILILSQADTDYQTIVSTMDTARSFKAVVAASVVDAELFPLISLGDAPETEELASNGGGQ